MKMQTFCIMILKKVRYKIMTKEQIQNICNRVDHTNLSKTATTTDIWALCSQAVQYNAASVCVPPYYVKFAKELLKDKYPKVCTVVGFPNGYSTRAVKIAETIDALKNGADEIDMVLNINLLKGGVSNYEKIVEEIRVLADVCHSGQYSENPATLKVIVETCLLTKEEIQRMCELCLKGHADYIKTSTGFDKAGANLDDVALMKWTIEDRPLKIKASGGIRTLEDAQKMLDAGADRIGASALFDEVRNLEKFDDRNKNDDMCR